MPKEIKNTFTHREPVALVWLPTLTIKDDIIQKNASSFYLRKKPEFIGNKHGVQTSLKSEKEKRRKQTQHNDGDQSRSMPPLSTTTIERSVPVLPVTSIQAILNHLDENQVPVLQLSFNN